MFKFVKAEEEKSCTFCSVLLKTIFVLGALSAIATAAYLIYQKFSDAFCGCCDCCGDDDDDLFDFDDDDCDCDCPDCGECCGEEAKDEQ